MVQEARRNWDLVQTPHATAATRELHALFADIQHATEYAVATDQTENAHRLTHHIGDLAERAMLIPQGRALCALALSKPSKPTTWRAAVENLDAILAAYAGDTTTARRQWKRAIHTYKCVSRTGSTENIRRVAHNNVPLLEHNLRHYSHTLVAWLRHELEAIDAEADQIWRSDPDNPAARLCSVLFRVRAAQLASDTADFPLALRLADETLHVANRDFPRETQWATALKLETLCWTNRHDDAEHLAADLISLAGSTDRPPELAAAAYGAASSFYEATANIPKALELAEVSAQYFDRDGVREVERIAATEHLLLLRELSGTSTRSQTAWNGDAPAPGTSSEAHEFGAPLANRALRLAVAEDPHARTATIHALDYACAAGATTIGLRSLAAALLLLRDTPTPKLDTKIRHLTRALPALADTYRACGVTVPDTDDATSRPEPTAPSLRPAARQAGRLARTHLTELKPRTRSSLAH